MGDAKEAEAKMSAIADLHCKKEQRVERMLICNTARCIIRDLLCGKRAVGISEEMRIRAQVIACRAIQSFTAASLIRDEDPDGVALAAALAGLETAGIATNVKEVLATFNARRLVDGLPEFCDSYGSLEGLRSATDLVLELETRLKPCIWALDSVATLPLDYVDCMVGFVGGRLPQNPTFVQWCAGRDAHVQAVSWSKQLATTTRCFLADAMMGPTSLLDMHPRVTAAAALALAAQLMLFRCGRASSRDHLVNLLEDLGATQGLVLTDLEQGIEEILSVFRLWKEVRNEQLSGCNAC